jgi:hypothetical protein
MFDACFTQAAFERGVACQDRNALIRQLLTDLPPVSYFLIYDKK